VCPINIQPNAVLHCTKHMTGVNCSDCPLSLFDEDVEMAYVNALPALGREHSVQTYCVCLSSQTIQYKACNSQEVP
jgi:hypothetical protein